jgi:acyl-CoA thioesterase-1
MLRRGFLALLLLAAVSSPGFSQNQPARPQAARDPNPAYAQITDDPALPRVLLIGDSISIGYTLPLREALKGKANLHRPADNCGPSNRGVAKLEEWLQIGGSDKWDVIQFNHGLHDIRHFSDPENKKAASATEGHRQVLEEEYEKNLRTIVARLKKTGAKLIWRNTTPVPEGSDGRVPGDEVRYNAIAKKIMDENQIPIDDMYSFCLPRLKEIQRPANVHFTDEGSKILADHTVKMIVDALPKTAAKK